MHEHHCAHAPHLLRINQSLHRRVLMVHGQRGRAIHLQQPRHEAAVHKVVEAKELRVRAPWAGGCAGCVAQCVLQPALVWQTRPEAGCGLAQRAALPPPPPPPPSPPLPHRAGMDSIVVPNPNPKKSDSTID